MLLATINAWENRNIQKSELFAENGKDDVLCSRKRKNFLFLYSYTNVNIATISALVLLGADRRILSKKNAFAFPTIGKPCQSHIQIYEHQVILTLCFCKNAT